VPDTAQEKAGERWVLIVHGGAKTIKPEKEEANRRGCLAALAAGREVLERGGAAVDAVEAAVRVLEDDPTFNAGRGSAPNKAGDIEMDASLMDGHTLDIGAVTGIREVRHPIAAARRLLRREEVLLEGIGAREFAERAGLEFIGTPALIGTGAEDMQHDTVGAVALDSNGHIATAVSTGGLEGQSRGRVGDSPLPGCGFYADDRVGGAVVSGDGEQVARVLLARSVLDLLGARDPDEAVREGVRMMAERVGGEAGVIVVGADGRLGWGHNSSHFAVAWQTADMQDGRVALRKNEAVAGQEESDGEA